MTRYSHALRQAGTCLAVALAALTAAAVPADAKPKPPPPKPVCNLLVDPAGDTSPSSPQLDILSADVASGLQTVVGVLRLKSLGVSDPVVALGARWELSFSTTGARYTFAAERNAAQVMTATFTREGDGLTTVYPATVFMDTTTSQVRWMVPRKLVRELPSSPAGDVALAKLAATTYALPTDHVVDTAFSSAVYLDGTPSCVKAA